MSATKSWIWDTLESPSFELSGDYPRSGYDEPQPDEQPKDYVMVDDKTADLPF